MKEYRQKKFPPSHDQIFIYYFFSPQNFHRSFKFLWPFFFQKLQNFFDIFSLLINFHDFSSPFIFPWFFQVIQTVNNPENTLVNNQIWSLTNNKWILNHFYIQLMVSFWWMTSRRTLIFSQTVLGRCYIQPAFLLWKSSCLMLLCSPNYVGYQIFRNSKTHPAYILCKTPKIPIFHNSIQILLHLFYYNDAIHCSTSIQQ